MPPNTTQFTSLKIRPIPISFFSPEISTSCSFILFIEIFNRWDGLFHAHSHTTRIIIITNRWILTHTFSFFPAIRFLQSSENTTCSQSPLVLLDAKSPHFPRELGRHKSKPPHFSHCSGLNLLESP